MIGFGGAHYASPWSAWTVVPSRVFVNNVVRPAPRRRVRDRLRREYGRQFVTRASGPTIAVASPARIAPLRAPTFARGAAVTRNGADPRSRPSDGSAPVRSGASPDRSASPSRSVSPDRYVSPSVNADGPRSRSRIPAAEPRSIDAPRSQSPSRVEVASRGRPAGRDALARHAASASRAAAIARAHTPTTRPGPSAPGRVYRSREPSSAPSDEPGARQYRSRIPSSPAVQAPPRGGFSADRSAPERVTAPVDRGRPENSAGAKPHPELRRARGPIRAARPRGEMRSPEPSSASPPSRAGSDNRSAGRQPSQPSQSSQSSGGRGQAVRRGGGT